MINHCCYYIRYDARDYPGQDAVSKSFIGEFSCHSLDELPRYSRLRGHAQCSLLKPNPPRSAHNITGLSNLVRR